MEGGARVFFLLIALPLFFPVPSFKSSYNQKIGEKVLGSKFGRESKCSVQMFAAFGTPSSGIYFCCTCFELERLMYTIEMDMR